MLLKQLTQEKVGYSIGYTSGFILDKYIRLSLIKSSYQKIAFIAKRTKIRRPTPTILFERSSDAIRDAY